MIEATQNKNIIPTLALFKKENRKLFETNHKLAFEYAGELEYEEALEHYSKAFQYTKDWKDYSGLINFFLKMERFDEALLAGLYLMQYQLEANEPKQAIQTLETCRQIPSFDKLEASQSVQLQFKLYLLADQKSRAIAIAGQSAKKLSKDQTGRLLKQIIELDPYCWESYFHLKEIMQDLPQKNHILLKGVCHAMEQKNWEVANCLCMPLEKIDLFCDALVYLETVIQQKGAEGVKEDLLGLAQRFEENKKTIPMVKAYKRLLQLGDGFISSDYYRKIIEGYRSLQKPQKVVDWYLSWLSYVISLKEWALAEIIAQEALPLTDQKIPYYEMLKTVYTNWHNHKIKDLWIQLGKAYFDSKNLGQAEKIYRKALESFDTWEAALGLAEVLKEGGKKGAKCQTILLRLQFSIGRRTTSRAFPLCRSNP